MYSIEFMVQLLQMEKAKELSGQSTFGEAIEASKIDRWIHYHTLKANLQKVTQVTELETSKNKQRLRKIIEAAKDLEWSVKAEKKKKLKTKFINTYHSKTNIFIALQESESIYQSKTNTSHFLQNLNDIND
ncbi:Hypothetical protein CINCED_3A014266 [Cinara cedri]|uniref:Uncharacterized protein n=1 Tax=Cinara cedri TaxID=506608 RepID=A0A5E4MZ91_9HEMI|nr:Hypothetical protein CINCED_3A014266 [Cinara cedri]